ncbi:precorrin-2/cobalt-factor-2 C20-methyltransferase [Desulfonatronum thiosulfatophilum]|uniref:Precorrin-2/cobalt-factor-2 C20-methyltransferase n=1 Tax=Desulfonatronum thiosulfatophilum TaxID=617002 RepID=A0A1G6BIF3_9BACT|nr:precorrin-2 C(20)-methyltransferase [Desulfonatronum thiosulfatophilum]SDB20349.1 precorrin-2/cobalt-factor-2 C20-methyltransferase [Desulfonatronum thiosulfatophilum]
MRSKQGILYGIGVGPGDPDLITLAAVKALAVVDTVFAPASIKNDFSLALDIIRPHLREDVLIRRLDFPMTRDDEIRCRARMQNAQAVLEHLNTGRSAAFITLGDPLIYSTFGHLSRDMRKCDADVDIRIIPGITSYQASAARLGRTLVEGDECLAVTTGNAEPEQLDRLLNTADAVVILKPAKRFAILRKALRDKGLDKRARLVERCGLSGESVYSNLDNVPEQLSYFSLLHIGRNRE